MPRILVIHGPNLNLLGKREPEIYGKITLDSINKDLKQNAKLQGIEVDIFQSNHEGEIVSLIGKSKSKFSGLIINPAAYTHTSIAIRDAIQAVNIPTIEVHLSNIFSREEFRHTSLIAPVVEGLICGFNEESYNLALMIIMKMVRKHRLKYKSAV